MYATGVLGWAHVTGAMQATLLTLMDLGFDVLKFTRWVAPDDQVFNPVQVAATSHAPLLQSVQAAAEMIAWRAAAKRPMSRGLEKGPPDLYPAKQARRELLQAELLDHARAVDLIACGGAWVPMDTRRCRCGLENVSSWHYCWTCPKLDECGHEYVRDTQSLMSVLLRDVDLCHDECLYARALLPRSKAQPLKLSVETIRPWACTGLQAACVASRRAYPDGSGGPGWVPRSVQRVGAGAAAFITDTDDLDDFKI